MNYWRCQCGEVGYHESGMPPRDCQGCHKCGTTLAQGPKLHKPVQQHDLELRYDPRTGKPSHNICRRCFERVDLEEGPDAKPAD